MDADGDGKIDAAEYEAWYHANVAPLWRKSHLRSLKHKPEGYTEGNLAVAWIKAVGTAAAACVLYYGALDQLSDVDLTTFVPCHGDHSCHYWQIFGRRDVPGSGAEFMQVRNGIYRPLALHETFQIYTVPYRDESEHGRRGLYEAVRKQIEEEEESVHVFSPVSRLSLQITKWPLVILTFPFSVGARLFDTFGGSEWGMENIAPAQCRDMSQEAMLKQCESDDTKRNIDNHMAGGASRLAVMFGLGFWSLTRAAHDVMLLQPPARRCRETTTLLVHGLALVFQGVAVAALFFWAMGAMGVFTAAVAGHEDCLCYYQLPTFQSHIALLTPFALLFLFAANVQMWGLAALYGDYVTSMTFTVPHYLARSSMLWTWQTLVSPVSSGTHGAFEEGEDTRREKFDKQDWSSLFRMQKFLSALRLLVSAFVALAACPFIVRYKEVMQAMLRSNSILHSTGRTLGMKVVLLLPSAVMWIFGAEIVLSLKSVCFPLGGKMTFADNLTTFLPDQIMDKVSVKRLKRQGDGMVEAMLAWAVFLAGSLITGVFAFAVGQGLCPDSSFLLQSVVPRTPNLAQAELWGACGFVLVCVVVQRLLAMIFMVYDELMLLKLLKEGDHNNNSNNVSSDNDGLLLSDNELRQARAPTTKSACC